MYFRRVRIWGFSVWFQRLVAQVYGFAKEQPFYAPVDEAHPLRPANCYALSKVVGEQAADYFVARFGLTILSFRFVMGIRDASAVWMQRLMSWRRIRARGLHCYGHGRTLVMLRWHVGSQSRQNR